MHYENDRVVHVLMLSKGCSQGAAQQAAAQNRNYISHDMFSSILEM